MTSSSFQSAALRAGVAASLLSFKTKHVAVAVNCAHSFSSKKRNETKIFAIISLCFYPLASPFPFYVKHYNKLTFCQNIARLNAKSCFLYAFVNSSSVFKNNNEFLAALNDPRRPRKI